MTYTVYGVASDSSAPGSYTYVDGYALEDESAFNVDSPDNFESDASDMKKMGYLTVVLVSEDTNGNREVLKVA